MVSLTASRAVDMGSNPIGAIYRFMDSSRIELESCRRERHVLPLNYEPNDTLKIKRFKLVVIRQRDLKIRINSIFNG